LNWTKIHKVRLLLAVATLIPIGVLAWLGVRILGQERDVERQRARESLEVAAGRFALEIDRRLADVEQGLGREEGLRFSVAGIETWPDLPLLYQPQTFVKREPSTSIFTPGETEEFKNQNLSAAAKIYQDLANSRDTGVRAAALLRLGRVLRTDGDSAGALDAYGKLLQLDANTTVGSDPVSLLAREARAKIFEEKSLMEELHREVSEMANELYRGALPIDRTTFGFYRDLIEKWGGPEPEVGAIARTEAAIDLWQLWRAGELPQRGRRMFREDGTAVLALWEQRTAWLATPDAIGALIAPVAHKQHLQVFLSDLDGQPILGSAAASGISLTPGDTRLPFIIKVTTLDQPLTQARRVLVTGLIVAFMLMIAAAVVIYRVTTRELMLARQQSDFVSAVSHEFRTPLTSMRHLTDLLVSRSVTSEERKTQYYELIAHETERLHRMVEGLLGFGRIEAGCYAWRLEPADAGELARTIVADFRREPSAAGREITCEIAEELPTIRVDRDALFSAVWNLMENAAKYSPTTSPIRVFVRRQQDRILLGVEDQGSGIPPGEQQSIFQKFVRGADAKQAGIRGVGIGLALVQRIIEAHGGSVQLQSEPGRGSTFTLVLPCPEF
jgi:signal transduction histidine kinase